VFTEKPFGYRHRAQFKYDAVHRRLGFFELETNRVVDIQECLCLTPGLNKLLKSLRSTLCSQSVADLNEIECYENDQQETAAFFHPIMPPHLAEAFPANPDLSVSFRNYHFPMNPKIFLQVNPGLWRVMIQEVEEHYAGLNLKSALELYCGAGFFTAPLSKYFERIVACEENFEAIQYAKTHHAIANVNWKSASVESYRFPGGLDAVIVDPARAGLHQNVLRELERCKPRYITYISCDCSTFARDLKKLKEIYKVEKLAMLDLFPQTFHFETIALLRWH
jgi:23S rRNA (uracil1939-C5)-methyltransferase